MTRETPPLLPVALSRRTTSCRMTARPARGLVRLLVLALALPCGGCSIFEDEFTWLDRAAPSTQKAPDAAPSGIEAGH